VAVKSGDCAEKASCETKAAPVSAKAGDCAEKASCETKAAPVSATCEPSLWRSGTQAVRAAYRGSACSSAKAKPVAAPAPKAGGCCASKGAVGVVRT
jgi:hypothetical protein